MTRYLLLLALALPATAQSPTLEQLIDAYIGAPWIMVPAQNGEQYVCIGAQASRQVDHIVSMIAEQAKAKCS